jgi:hypothetical protein
MMSMRRTKPNAAFIDRASIDWVIRTAVKLRNVKAD